MAVITYKGDSWIRELSLTCLGCRCNVLVIQICSHLIFMERRAAKAILEIFEEKAESSNLKPLPVQRMQGKEQG